MPALLALDSGRWRLEIAGPLRELPPFLPVPTDSVISCDGNAQLKILSRDTGELTPRPPASLNAPLFFENTGYDCYLQSQSGQASLRLPPGAIERHHTGTVAHFAISFGNDVGYVELAVQYGSEVIPLRFEVFPLKLD